MILSMAFIEIFLFVFPIRDRRRAPIVELHLRWHLSRAPDPDHTYWLM
jgi:hypothetical protein